LASAWDAKNLEDMKIEFVIWIYCNPLESHKTAKAFLGKVWRKKG
jgi:hypothetical protein